MFETCNQILELDEDGRRTVFAKLAGFASTVNIVLDSKHGLGLSEDALQNWYSAILEYLIGLFPAEIARCIDSSHICSTRPTHFSIDGRAIPRRLEGNAVSDYAVWLSKECTNGQTVGTELLLTSLCERSPSQKLLTGSRHPSSHEKVWCTEQAFTNLYRIYDEDRVDGSPKPGSFTAMLRSKLNDLNDCEIISSETWTAVHDSLFHEHTGKRFAGLATFRTFFYGIALKKMATHFERRRREREKLEKLKEHIKESENFASPTGEPELNPRDASRESLLNDLLAERPISPGLPGGAFDEATQQQLLQTAGMSPTMRLVAATFYFLMLDADKAKPHTKASVARIHGITPAQVNHLINGENRRGIRVPGADALLRTRMIELLGKDRGGIR